MGCGQAEGTVVEVVALALQLQQNNIYVFRAELNNDLTAVFLLLCDRQSLRE